MTTTDDQAIRWQDAIYTELEALAQLPERCSLALENGNHVQELRQLLVGLSNQRSYRAIFTIVDREVHVLTVQRCHSVSLVRPTRACF
ncbi:type II toxin-antitoxin system RelE/ParE family toxin [Roseimaritima ulvae]|uniref:type II toxin-antitoxin system RelE/ParE family toxin n=1 Tax=Roseimaritima ulvae TaxID=980254 RepID=UPI0008335620|nr:hypothetical protein [Roseimaritima ulvae]